MIPLNEYQKKIYESIVSTDFKTFDEVPTDEDFPLVTIGDYTLSEGETKCEDYTINQVINIYSDYEGKKEINEMVSIVLDKLNGLINSSITDTFSIVDVKLLESPVSRGEDGIYTANLNIQFGLEGE